MTEIPEPNPIFTVTTLHLRGHTFGISPRTVGWYPNKQSAMDCIQENRGDIFETTYTYAVVEELPWGLYPKPASEVWFKWSHELGSYQPCERPSEFAGVLSCGTIG